MRPQPTPAKRFPSMLRKGQYGQDPQPVYERFWEKVVIPDNPSDCWIWVGTRDKYGYGQISVGSEADNSQRKMKAHRFSFLLHYGEPSPKKPHVLHHCDNPPCMNPQHLFAGTNSDNQWDKVKKGRHHEQAITHCPQEHPYDEENTILYGGRRYCRACQRKRGRERMRRNRAALRETRGEHAASA